MRRKIDTDRDARTSVVLTKAATGNQHGARCLRDDPLSGGAEYTLGKADRSSGISDGDQVGAHRNRRSQDRFPGTTLFAGSLTAQAERLTALALFLELLQGVLEAPLEACSQRLARRSRTRGELMPGMIQAHLARMHQPECCPVARAVGTASCIARCPDSPRSVPTTMVLMVISESAEQAPCQVQNDSSATPRSRAHIPGSESMWITYSKKSESVTMPTSIPRSTTGTQPYR